ncbi:XRE family transcriptional regulator [Streptomyces sp. VRA16 Mangrove soil]|uniref:XRE family transcriptional regulator n=1 Tax=Streptomyces sp. VRA16 Mangrove soil TaxID=2817434 RepID=UPI001A9D2ADD|nr:XRE family transcriptional regulator [Streptomyces sp. VRA16 Mangrove soil]MBO1333973.1 XRE family transcriptional regulator [Streptomyces sp. VRA16 Mangrove soil]
MSNRSTFIMPERPDVSPPEQPLRYGLRAPDTPLGRARLEREWSRAKAVRALTLVAERWGWEIAAEASMKVMYHRWEHEAVRPGKTYQVLLCSVFRKTPDELGFAEQSPCADEAALLARISALESVVRHLLRERCDQLESSVITAAEAGLTA